MTMATEGANGFVARLTSVMWHVTGILAMLHIARTSSVQAAPRVGVLGAITCQDSVKRSALAGFELVTTVGAEVQ